MRNLIWCRRVAPKPDRPPRVIAEVMEVKAIHRLRAGTRGGRSGKRTVKSILAAGTERDGIQEAAPPRPSASAWPASVRHHDCETE